MTAEHTTTAHMDIEGDRHTPGWVGRTVTILEDGMRDIETQPITVAEAIEIVGDRDQVITETQETIARLREQEATRRQELANGEWPAEDEDDLRDDLERWVQGTDDLADSLRDAVLAANGLTPEQRETVAGIVVRMRADGWGSPVLDTRALADEHAEFPGNFGDDEVGDAGDGAIVLFRDPAAHPSGGVEHEIPERGLVIAADGRIVA